MKVKTESFFYPASSVLIDKPWSSNRLEQNTHCGYFGLHLMVKLSHAQIAADVKTLMERFDVFRVVDMQNEKWKMQFFASLESLLPDIIKKNLEPPELETFLNNHGVDLQDAFSRKVIVNEDGYGRQSIIIFHHPLLLDYSSKQTVIREFAEIVQGKTPKTTPIRFGDYLNWMNDFAQRPESDNIRRYWKSLSSSFDKSPVLVPKYDNITRPPDVARRSFLRTEIKNYCQEVFFLSAFVVLVQKYFQSDDILVLVETDLRPYDIPHDTVGNFDTILPLYQSINSGETVATLMENIASLLKQYAGSLYLPFPELADSVSGYQLTNFRFNFKRDVGGQLSSDGFFGSEVQVRAKFNIDVVAYEDSFEFSIELDSEVFPQGQAERLATYYFNILSAAANAPDCSITEIEMLSVAEQKLLIETFNDTDFDYGFERPMNVQFEFVTGRVPQRIAAIDKYRSVTYSELNSLSNKIAWTLMAGGSCKNTFIGVYLERSISHLAAMLAIFKAGGLYLPLSLKNPRERTLFYLSDSDAAIVIADRTSLHDVESRLPKGIRVVCLSNNPNEQGLEAKQNIHFLDEIDQAPEHNPPNLNAIRDMAFILYTSGSTGSPKGAILRYDGLFNQIFSKIVTFRLAPGFTMLHTAPVSSDISVWQFVGAISHEGTVVIGDENEVNVPEPLHALIETHSVDLIELVPTVADLLADFVNRLPKIARGMPALKVMMICGEEFHKNLVNKCLQMKEGLSVFNAYGPAEASDDVSLFEINSIIPDNVEKVSIGKPVQNMRIYILDKYGALLPQGVIGEICMAGVGVGAGYWKNDTLSAAKFVKNKYGRNELEDTLYKSGDLGQWLPDGNLVFFGRMDNQIKINGNRIEIGEIESQIDSFEGIKKAIVVLVNNPGHRSGADDSKQLIAFFTTYTEINLDSLKEFLILRLPVFMIPSRFIWQSEFTLSLNGKIDRKKLVEHAYAIIEKKTEIVAPEDDIEAILLLQWKESLKSDTLGVLDNFFEAGGNSLKAMVLQARIYNRIGKQIQISTIFKNPTVREMARVLKTEQQRVTDIIMPIPEAPYYDLSHAQKRLWILSLIEDERAAYNMPYTFVVNGELNSDVLNQSFLLLLGRHEILRTAIVDVNNEPKQKVFSAEQLGFKVDYLDVSSLDEPEAHALELIRSDAHTEFDLTMPPLIRSKVFRISKDSYRVLINIHHIISDGWSENILLNELFSNYSSLKAGKVLQKDPLKFHYKDYAAWHNNLVEKTLSKSRDFWLLKLKESIIPVPLPYDFSRPSVKTFNGGRLGFFIDQETTSQLHGLCRKNGLTLYMGLLTGVKAMLYRYSGAMDIVIGSPTAGRSHPDLDEQIGFYVNTLALRTSIDGDDSFDGLSKKVRTNSLDAFEHQLYPFDLLVDELGIQRDLSRSPVFDIFVALQNISSVEVEVDDAIHGDIHEQESDFTISKFDISFYFEEKSNGIGIGIEYNTDLFRNSTVVRLGNNLIHLLRMMLLSPATPINRIDFPAPAEQQQLHQKFNSSPEIRNLDVPILQLFEESMKRLPSKPAIVCESEILSYEQLANETDRLSAFIEKVNRNQCSLIGVFMERTALLPVTLLSIWKAGFTYVPIDMSSPENRILTILLDTGISTIITRAKHAALMERLKMRCETFNQYICLDDPDASPQAEDQMRELWNIFADQADDYAASGWIDPRTHAVYSEIEMAEFFQNIRTKLSPLLSKDMHVLEVGCGSGITAFELAAGVATYTATDISDVVIERCRRRATERNIPGLNFITRSASEIRLVDARYDLIIVNSVFQYFPDISYAKDFIGDCVRILRPNGIIFIGDIKDADLKDACQKFVGIPPEQDDELYYSKNFLQKVFEDQSHNFSLEFLAKIGTIENDLKRFRYDVLATSTKNIVKEIKKRTGYFKKDIDPVPVTAAPNKHHAGKDAYVIFTSGSTGNPKGVVVNSRSVLNFIRGMQVELGLSESDRFLALTSYTFDISVLELMMPLLIGGTMCLVHEKALKNPTEIESVIRQTKPTVMQATPSVFRMLLDNECTLKGDMKLICGGEKLEKELGLKLLANAGNLWNVYGPTETTIWSTVQKIETPDNLNFIGKPLANTLLYVLNPFGQSVPIGAKGELFIGGDGLAKGYLNQPELTRERFVNNDRYGLLYKTGDICKWAENGRLQFLGREDSQVKMMGHRIELSEIEQSLERSGLASVVAVLCKTDTDGAPYLSCFFSGGDLSQLKEYATKNLPLHMIPSRWITIQEWPLNTNGKVDRLRLDENVFKEKDSQKNQRQPASRIERAMLEIWKSILKNELISVDDNFFGVGGNSLKAIQVVSRIRKDLSLAVELKSLFDQGTVVMLAKSATPIRESGYDLAEMSTAGEGFLSSHAQRRFYVASAREESHIYNITHILEVDGAINEPALQHSLNRLVERHQILRSVFYLKEGNLWQKTAPANEKGYDLKWIEPDDLDDIQQVLTKEATTAFDLHQGPLLKVVVICKKTGEHILFLVAHHIISDGHSIKILARDLTLFYETFLGKKPFPYPEMKFQFKDYANWEHRLLAGPQGQEMKNYWLSQLGDLKESYQLPTPYSRITKRLNQKNSYSFMLEKDDFQSVLEIKNRSNTSIYTVLVAALNVVLHKQLTKKEILIGTPVSTRLMAELEDQVGPFINTVVLKSVITNEPFEELLAGVNRTVRDALHHSLYPFDKLVEDLNDGQMNLLNPLFDIGIGYYDLLHESSGDATFDHNEDQVTVTQLWFNIVRTDYGLRFRINYSHAAFEDATIQGISESLIMVIRQVALSPHLTVENIVSVTKNSEINVEEVKISLDI